MVDICRLDSVDSSVNNYIIVNSKCYRELLMYPRLSQKQPLPIDSVYISETVILRHFTLLQKAANMIIDHYPSGLRSSIGQKTQKLVNMYHQSQGRFSLAVGSKPTSLTLHYLFALYLQL